MMCRCKLVHAELHGQPLLQSSQQLPAAGLSRAEQNAIWQVAEVGWGRYPQGIRCRWYGTLTTVSARVHTALCIVRFVWHGCPHSAAGSSAAAHHLEKLSWQLCLPASVITKE